MKKIGSVFKRPKPEVERDALATIGKIVGVPDGSSVQLIVEAVRAREAHRRRLLGSVERLVVRPTVH